MKRDFASKPFVRRMVIAAAVTACIGAGMIIGLLPMHKNPVLAAENTPAESSVTQVFVEHGARALAIANIFRIKASADIDAAMKTSTSPEYYDSWAAQNAQIDSSSFLWEDFYSTAIIFVGRVSPEKAVIVFYNPWTDMAIIAGVDLERALFFEGSLLTGDSLRGEQFSDVNAAQPAWAREASSLPVSLGRVYAPTTKIIERLFPPESPYVLLPEHLAERAKADDNEFAAFIVRELNRAQMFAKLVSPEEGAQKALVSEVARVLAAVNRGERSAFNHSSFEEQRPEMTEILLNLPIELRSQMAPNFLLIQENGAVAAYVNPASPQWFVTAYMAGAQADIAVKSIEIFKFESLHLLK